MKFEWDARKAIANRRKHGVSFQEASEIIGHELSITIDDLTHSEDEDREKTIGITGRGRILVVIHVRRDDVIRIIGARKADRQEVADYEEEINERLKET